MLRKYLSVDGLKMIVVKRFSLLTCLVAALWAATCGISAAQRYVPYATSQPALSPYLQITRQNTGSLPSYFTFVRPRIEQQDFVNRQLAVNARAQTRLYQQQQELSGLTRRFEDRAATTMGREAPLQMQRREAARRPAATYMDTSHFFGGGDRLRGRRSRYPEALKELTAPARGY